MSCFARMDAGGWSITYVATAREACEILGPQR